MKRYLTALVAVAIVGCAGHALAQKPQANVLTNEELKALLSKGLTVKVTIPMPGGAESLNVAAAAAICFYELSRRAARS